MLYSGTFARWKTQPTCQAIFAMPTFLRSADAWARMKSSPDRRDVEMYGQTSMWSNLDQFIEAESREVV